MTHEYTLKITPRVGRVTTWNKDGNGTRSYHFEVVTVAGGHQAADLFTIPALIHWNDQLKRDIVASLHDALKEVFQAEDVARMQEEAWTQMQDIH